jgi:hypothetical protein
MFRGHGAHRAVRIPVTLEDQTMFTLRTLGVALVLSAATPLIAAAQSQPNDAQSDPASGPAAATAATYGANAATHPIPADQLPPAQAQALANGDNKLITNGPVPDTAANRAKYGGPMSHAGKHTPPVGN